MILGYARVSTIDQAEEDRTSLPEQENVIHGYALTQGVDRFGVQIYSDAGVSARTPLRERPQGIRLLEDAAAGDTIVASKMDRIFRSARDALEMVDYFRHKGIHLVLFDIGVAPVTSDEGTSRLFFTMLAAFAEFERTRIRERMLQGKGAKAKKGGHIGGEAPYGWRIEGEGRAAKLVAHPEEQRVISIVRHQIANPQFTHMRMVHDLNGRGLRNRTGKPFACYQVQRIAERLRAN